MSNKKSALILFIMASLLITFIWCVEWRGDNVSVAPVKPTMVNAKATVKTVAPVKRKIKTRVKRVTRSYVREFTAPTTGHNRGIGRRLAAQHGWTGKQWDCLNNLWQKESGWSTRSTNSSGTAHGIPQALPGSKMRSAGKDWRTNPATQIAWGIGYIDNRYGTACKAWSHWQQHNWY